MASTVHRNYKVPISERAKIRQMYADGATLTEIAKQYRVTLGCIRYHIHHNDKQGSCRVCGKVTAGTSYWRGAHSHCYRQSSRLGAYGLTGSEYQGMLVEQDGKCAICGDAMNAPHIDHDHKSGVIRGLLCARCNKGLGHFLDDPTSLRRAIVYLSLMPTDTRCSL